MKNQTQWTFYIELLLDHILKRIKRFIIIYCLDILQQIFNDTLKKGFHVISQNHNSKEKYLNYSNEMSKRWYLKWTSYDGICISVLIAADTVEPSASPPKEAATYTPFPTTALSMVIHTKEEKHAKIIMIVTSMNLFLFILI